jgi:class 3 adenylate cyclase
VLADPTIHPAKFPRTPELIAVRINMSRSARAIECACAIRDGARQLGMDVRVGLHTGEIELRGDDIGGLTVNVASRVTDLASQNDVLVSRTVTDLVAGSAIRFEDRGEHELKGVPGPGSS